ncbi:MAG: hypothetical protein EXS36_04900 [Pedosphaera sp.]|nr:hypothetical protein [Pedosphaera sp.]
MFESTWNAASHPQSFPSGAHWFPLIGGTHNSSVTFWEEGETPTQGIEDLAELGNVVALRNEVTGPLPQRTPSMYSAVPDPSHFRGGDTDVHDSSGFSTRHACHNDRTESRLVHRRPQPVPA